MGQSTSGAAGGQPDAMPPGPMTPQHARRAAWYARYARLSALPLFLLGLLFLLSFIIKLSPGSPAEDVKFANSVIVVTWAAFAIDYSIGLLLAPSRWVFIKTHVLEAAAVAFPPMRILLLGQTFKVLRNEVRRKGDVAREGMLYLTALMLVFGAIAVTYFEASASNGNIKSFSDAFWWTGETVSTVGYGDYYPVTVGGRLVAWALFINGVAVISVITGSLAQSFSSGGGFTKPKGSKTTPTAADGAATETAAAAAAAETADASVSGGSVMPTVLTAPFDKAASDVADDVVKISRRDLSRLTARLDELSSELHDMRTHVSSFGAAHAGDAGADDAGPPGR